VEPDYSLILETLAEPVVAADRSGRIVFANRAAEELLGWPPGGLRGLPLTAIIPPHLRTRHTAGFNRYRSSWVPRIIGKNIRVAARRKNGSEVRIELTVSSFRGRGGEELYAASLRDLRGRVEPERGPESAWQRALDEVLSLFCDPPPGEERELGLRLVTALEHRFEADQAQLWISTEEGQHLQLLAQNPSASRPAARELEWADAGSPVAEAARSRSVMINPSSDPCGAAAAAYLALLHGGLLLGILVYRSGTPFTESTLRVLRRFALLTAGALHGERCRRAEDLRDQYRRRLEAVGELIAAGASGAEIEPVLNLALERVLELTGLEEGLIALKHHERLVIRASRGTRHSQVGAEIPPGEDVPQQVLHTGASVLVPDYQESPAGSAALRQRGARAVLGVPLRLGSYVIGVLQVASRKKARPILDEDRQTVEALAGALAPAIRLGV